MTTLGVLWFALVGVLLAGYALFDGFDLGVGTLYPFLGKNDDDKEIMRSSIGPVWDGNEVWLLTGGGAIFAAFPTVYATVFSGFYLALMLVLFALIFRAVSFEFYAHDPAWRKRVGLGVLPGQRAAGAALRRRGRQHRPRRAAGQDGRVHRQLLHAAEPLCARAWACSAW